MGQLPIPKVPTAGSFGIEARGYPIRVSGASGEGTGEGDNVNPEKIQIL